jgi:hypothetical protein
LSLLEEFQRRYRSEPVKPQLYDFKKRLISWTFFLFLFWWLMACSG